MIDLHVHTTASDGQYTPSQIIQMASEKNISTIAITDHGVMFGAIDFYKACKANGVKPIIGCEVYVAPRTRFDKEPNIDNKYYHLILLAKNNDGYKNLAKLVSLSFVDGYYYKPRIDKEALENTTRIAERCHIELTFGKLLLPEFPIPSEFKNAGVYVRNLCEKESNVRYASVLNPLGYIKRKEKYKEIIPQTIWQSKENQLLKII